MIRTLVCKELDSCSWNDLFLSQFPAHCARPELHSGLPIFQIVYLGVDRVELLLFETVLKKQDKILSQCGQIVSGFCPHCVHICPDFVQFCPDEKENRENGFKLF